MRILSEKQSIISRNLTDCISSHMDLQFSLLYVCVHVCVNCVWTGAYFKNLSELHKRRSSRESSDARGVPHRGPEASPLSPTLGMKPINLEERYYNLTANFQHFAKIWICPTDKSISALCIHKEQKAYTVVGVMLQYGALPTNYPDPDPDPEPRQ